MFYLFCYDCKGALEEEDWAGGIVFVDCCPDLVTGFGLSFV
jgi:hypothetical protein